jgi:hypothetical protein
VLEDLGIRNRRTLFFPALAIDHALDSVPQVSNLEINQQPDSDAALPHETFQNNPHIFLASVEISRNLTNAN